MMEMRYTIRLSHLIPEMAISSVIGLLFGLMVAVQIPRVNLVFAILALMLALAFFPAVFGGASYLNRRRILSYFAEEGSHVIEIQWSPFAPGWLGRGFFNLYTVRYRDANETNHTAVCHTNVFGGVYTGRPA